MAFGWNRAKRFGTVSSVGREPTPEVGDGPERLHLLQRWLDLEAQCDRELANQFHRARHRSESAPPALSPDIEGLLLAAERAKAAYRATKK
ncbi:hypothetical protein GCM10009740_31220 [Terrabacter terrae]|uniref:Uncharacterized protein n=1 Tax=Terrabacter terrae TaxID=318434 RepID=A0ABN2UIN1_9MICO